MAKSKDDWKEVPIDDWQEVSVAPKGETAQQSQIRRADESSGGQFIPDTGTMGPVETAFKTGRDQVLMGYGEQAVEAASRGIAKINPMISKEQYQEQYANGSIADASKADREALRAGQDVNPGAELIGTLGGEAVSQAASEGAFRALAVGFRPVKAAAKAVTELMETGAAKVAGTVPGLTPRWVKEIGGHPAIKELGQFLNDKGVTTVPGTLRKVGERLTKIKDEIGKDIGKVWDKSHDAVDEITKIDGGTVEQSTIKYVEDAYAAGKMAAPDDTAKAVTKELKRFKNSMYHPDGSLNIKGTREVIATLENESGKFAKSDMAKSTIKDITSDGLRNVLKDEVKILLPPAEYEKLIELNRQYFLAKTADKTIQKTLGESIWTKAAKKGVATYIGSEVGGFVGEGLGNEQLGRKIGKAAGLGSSLTSVRTTVSSLLHLAPKLGKFGEQIVQVAAKHGYKKALARHAYMYMSNKAYRSKVDENGGLTSQNEQQE